LKTLDVAAKSAPKVERIYRSYSKIKRLADQASEDRFAAPRIRPLHSGFGIVEKEESSAPQRRTEF
jgi:murein endopeptidase